MVRHNWFHVAAMLLGVIAPALATAAAAATALAPAVRADTFATYEVEKHGSSTVESACEDTSGLEEEVSSLTVARCTVVDDSLVPETVRPRRSYHSDFP